MILKSEDLMKSFYKEIKDEYKELSYLDVRKIIISPFKMIRYHISNMTFEDVRLIYIGVFKIHKIRLKKKLKIDEDLSEDIKLKIKKYLEE